ncbi:hypothetical protein DXD68_04155 [Parabacteroides sp. TM07-1AC]|nr:hypothetical protein DXD68_04155 [Parabacteroides sp. TM07-1AC]
MGKKFYLTSWINFGKYRSSPARLKSIIETSEGRKWLRWMIANTVTFEFDKLVLDYLEQQEENARHLLQPV